MTTIKIRLPEKLPSEKLTPVKFKAWKGQLVVFLKQSHDYRRFLHGGIYATWSANDEVQDRIAVLHADDQPQAGGDAGRLLADRQTQLETFLSIIAGLCDASQYEDVMQRSTNIEWIWNLIESDYDIQKKGRHFLKLDAIAYNKAGTESYTAFYKRLRSHFTDNLRKTGEQVGSRNNEQLTEDEKISPTLENTIVFMALRDIDPRLPSYVEQVYGHRMDRHTTLYDLQTEIFQALPKLLTDLGMKDATFGAIDQVYNDQDQQLEPQDLPTCAAATGFQRYNDTPTQRFTFRQRNNTAQQGQPAQQGQRGRYQTSGQRNGPQVRFRPQQNQTGKLCNLCRDAGFPMRVCQTHNMSECNRWNRSSIAQIRSMVLEDNIDPMEYPDSNYFEEDEA